MIMVVMPCYQFHNLTRRAMLGGETCPYSSMVATEVERVKDIAQKAAWRWTRQLPQQPLARRRGFQQHYRDPVDEGHIASGGRVVLTDIMQEGGLQDVGVVTAIYQHAAVDGKGVPLVLGGHGGEERVESGAQHAPCFRHLRWAHSSEEGREELA